MFRFDFKHHLGKLAATSTTKMDDILIFTTVAGWVASSAAQIFGIARNKNYSKEQKKFMIRQEISDAGTNIALYLSITKPLAMLTETMVKTAKLAPKSVVDFMRRSGITGNRGKLGFDITQAKGFDEAGLRGVYDAFKCFACVTATTIGGIISSNIITPIVRNKIAASRQNKPSIADGLITTNPPANNLPVKPVNTIVTPRHTFDDFRSRVLSI